MAFHQNQEVKFCGRLIDNATIERGQNNQDLLVLKMEVTETISTKQGEIKNKYFYKVSEQGENGSFKAVIQSLIEGAFVEVTCTLPKELRSEDVDGQPFHLLRAKDKSTRILQPAPEKPKRFSLFGLKF